MRTSGGVSTLLLALLAVILVPFFLFGAGIEAWTGLALRGDLARSAGMLLILGLLASDILLPVPSSVVSIAAGALLGVPVGAAASWAGMTLGCIMGYVLGSRGRGTVEKLVGSAALEAVERGMRRHGAASVVVARAIPVLAEATVLVAGLSRVPFWPFVIRVAAANLGVSVAYAIVGQRALTTGSFLPVFLAAVTLPFLGWLGLRVLRADVWVGGAVARRRPGNVED